jgi:hypothetical protein
MVRRHQSNRQRSTEQDTWLTDRFEAIARAWPSDVSRPAYDTNRLRQCTAFSGDSLHRVRIMSNFGMIRFGILIAISDASTETGICWGSSRMLDGKRYLSGHADVVQRRTNTSNYRPRTCPNPSTRRFYQTPRLLSGPRFQPASTTAIMESEEFPEPAHQPRVVKVNRK